MRLKTWIFTVCLSGLVTSGAIAQQTVGLFLHDPAQSFPGYTLIGPSQGTVVYLINNDGLVVHQWETGLKPGLMGYLREDGHLVRGGRDPNIVAPPGIGGLVQDFDWDGNLVWDLEGADLGVLQHHDIHLLPNGNILMTAWEVKTPAEVLQAGRNPTGGGETWPDALFELEQLTGGGTTVVWEWHAWDHLVQDFDVTKDNFGVVADHPELIDINFGPMPAQSWIHANGVGYNAALDQIIVSSRSFSEFWILDHSTTTAEAAGHTGGTSGKGGDLLYRWGNPQAYDRGTAADERLFVQHDAQFVAPGSPGEGSITVFNNGTGRPGGPYSSADEVVPPATDVNGNYPIAPGQPYGPELALWSYRSNPVSEFYSAFIAGVHRLPNGNSLICEGMEGRLFEVTEEFEIVWEWRNPVGTQGSVQQGQVPGQGQVFKVRRYPLDYPAFIGKDLTPGNPVEQFLTPFAVADNDLSASRLDDTGSQIQVSWDASTCTSFDYNLLYGSLDAVADAAPTGSACGIGTTGSFTWTNAPAGSLYFLIVGRDQTGVYESTWGSNSSGAPRGGTHASFQCGATTKILVDNCP